MDLYHKVLLQVYEATSGKDSLSVNLKEIVKDAGFFGSYMDIFKQLSRQGWIAETRRADEVKITHWGIKEIKNSLDENVSASDNARSLESEVGKLLTEAKKFAILVEEIKSDISKSTIETAENKLNEINNGLKKLKENV